MYNSPKKKNKIYKISLFKFKITDKLKVAENLFEILFKDLMNLKKIEET